MTLSRADRIAFWEKRVCEAQAEVDDLPQEEAESQAYFDDMIHFAERNLEHAQTMLALVSSTNTEDVLLLVERDALVVRTREFEAESRAYHDAHSALDRTRAAHTKRMREFSLRVARSAKPVFSTDDSDSLRDVCAECDKY